MIPAFYTPYTARHVTSSLTPDAVSNDLLRARALQRGGNVVAAQALCRALLAQRPHHSDALCLLGQLLVQDEHFGAAVLLLRRAAALGADAVETNHDLARALIGCGRDDEAIPVLQIALRKSPTQVSIVQLLASTLHRRMRFDEARALLGDAVFQLGATTAATDLLEYWANLMPDDPAPAHRLAAMRDSAPPARAADEYVTYLFDRYADTFEQSLSGLGYQGPVLIAKLLQASGFAPRKQLNILDAGCGTGLCAPALLPYAARLTGVDLSPAMVEKARQRGDYDSLVVAELSDFLGRHTAHFDLIAVMDTFVYFGELGEAFRNAANALRPGGYLAFTLEKTDAASQGYQLNANARYSHTPAYVSQQLADAGFNTRLLDDAVLRDNDAAPVHGLAVLASRGAAA